eukprot:7383744-Prymnesium_polylepis.1
MIRDRCCEAPVGEGVVDVDDCLVSHAEVLRCARLHRDVERMDVACDNGGACLDGEGVNRLRQDTISLHGDERDGLARDLRSELHQEPLDLLRSISRSI